MAGVAAADSGAVVDRMAADGVIFYDGPVGPEKLQRRPFLHQDISVPVLGKMFDVAFEPDVVQQRIIVLVVYLTLIIITNGFAEGRHPDPAFGVTEHFQDLYIRQTIDGGVVVEISSVESADACFGAGPDKAVFILCDAINSGAGKAIGNIVMGIAVFLR